MRHILSPGGFIEGNLGWQASLSKPKSGEAFGRSAPRMGLASEIRRIRRAVMGFRHFSYDSPRGGGREYEDAPMFGLRGFY